MSSVPWPPKPPVATDNPTLLSMTENCLMNFPLGSKIATESLPSSSPTTMSCWPSPVTFPLATDSGPL